MDPGSLIIKPAISIIGGGIGGLTLARCLLAQGIKAEIYERASSAKPNNYGITLYSSSYRPLLKCLGADEHKFRNSLAVDAAPSGASGGNIKWHANSETESFVANRGKLEAWLREDLNVNWGYDLKRVEKGSDKGGLKSTLIFENGSKANSDVVIGADGPHSSLRELFLPQEKLTILPYVVFNGKRRLSREEFAKKYDGKASNVQFKHRDARVNISMNGVTPDQVNLSWTYSRPAHGPSDALHRPERSQSSATETPPELFDEIASLKQLGHMPPLIDEAMDPERLRGERILHWLMRTILLPRDELDQHASNGIVFIGDAAHAEPILGGQGANTAIDDAVSLAAWLAEQKSPQKWYDTRYPAWDESAKRNEQRIKQLHSPDPENHQAAL